MTTTETRTSDQLWDQVTRVEMALLWERERGNTDQVERLRKEYSEVYTRALAATPRRTPVVETPVQTINMDSLFDGFRGARRSGRRTGWRR